MTSRGGVVPVRGANAFAVGLLMVLGAAFAGCVSGGAKNVRANLNGPNSVPEFDDDTGAIRGQVVDVEQIPLGGAEVGILAVAILSKTDEQGFFALNHVPPGEHIVAVAMLGFEPMAKAVTVIAGQSTDVVTFELTPLPSEDPYEVTVQLRAQLSGVMWKLTPQCIYTDVNPLVKTCGGVRAGAAAVGGQELVKGCAACETHTNDGKHPKFTSDWQTIVVEVAWTAQSGVTGKGFQLDLNAPNITRGTSGSINQADKYTWSKATNKAPLTIRVDKDALLARGIKETDYNNYNGTEPRCKGTASAPPNNNCDWFFRLFPAAYDAGSGEQGPTPDYGVMLESTAEIYFSYFVKKKAPADFTALPQ